HRTHIIFFLTYMRTENIEQRTENREQRTENREQRTENRAYINKFRYWSNLELKFYYRKQKNSFYP
ncbi:hypothetical protein C5U10_13010, partial [Acinetobacter baumannii]